MCRHFRPVRAVCRSRASFTFNLGDEAQQQCRCHSPAALSMAVSPRHSSPAHPPQRTALPEPTHAFPRPSSSRSTFRFAPSRRTVLRRAQVRAPCFAVCLTPRARQCTPNDMSPCIIPGAHARQCRAHGRASTKGEFDHHLFFGYSVPETRCCLPLTFTFAPQNISILRQGLVFIFWMYRRRCLPC